jgi:two-component system, cell cycle sensor histidine kinase and response regulator CckA
MNGKQRILIAEDEPVAGMKLQVILERAGFEVLLAANGEDALQRLAGFSPDVVITDVMMPGVNGFELCRRIRADEKLRRILVVLLTALTEPGDVLRGLSVGADNFIVKPFDSEALLNSIRQMLSPRYRSLRDEPAAGIELDYRGKPYVITANRLQVLNFFVNIYETQFRHQLDLISAKDELAALSRNLERMVEDRTAALTEEIQERKLAEQRISEQAALLDLAHDAIIVTATDGEVIYWNKSAEKLYGWSAREAIGRNVGILVTGGDAGVNAPARVATREGTAWSGEVVHRSKAGGELAVMSSWTPVRDSDGLLKSVLMINTDVTQKKALEAKYLRAQRLESLGSLAGGIAHDLNNVLSPIMLAMSLLKNNVKDESSQQMLTLVEESARRGSDMVKQVMMLGKGVGGERMNLQPRHLMRELRKIIDQSFPRTIRLAMDNPGALPLVNADAAQLQQVLLNLCVNARDAMPDGGILSVSAEDVMVDGQNDAQQQDAAQGRYVLLKVSDTGVGIPSDLHAKIFDPFFTTKETGGGTGLGLSTVVSIVRSHGGFVRVHSKVGKGTTFEVFLPAIADESVPVASTPEQKGRHGRNEMILVVDDEHIVREITKATLLDNGYQVMTAKDGPEALALYAQHCHSIAVVITDVIMPYLDGPTTIRALQQINPGVKVIQCSGLSADEKRVGPKPLTGIPLLEKPYTADTLLVKLGEVLAK